MFATHDHPPPPTATKFPYSHRETKRSLPPQWEGFLGKYPLQRREFPNVLDAFSKVKRILVPRFDQGNAEAFGGPQDRRPGAGRPFRRPFSLAADEPDVVRHEMASRYRRRRRSSASIGIWREEIKVQYNVRNSAAVKLVTKASQWRKIGTQRKRRKSRGMFNLRITSFTGNSERQSVVRCTVVSSEILNQGGF
ncbi:hypothetical protein EVAR_43467_1 [Eumeta japonica]|uniref:Uncharacterized protein n=1 Tax=Eumeta variegata TaxID=151549 RepID=A0A4C1Z068_EUMVA|nr:hypothetical protein EVAR_43467_1 [Eumeta japonica]